MDRSFLKFVWRFSRREQLFVLLLTVVSFPLVYLSLEIPKIIINEAIGGRNFPKEVLWLELGQIEYLLALCLAFLVLVVAINGIKWVLNVAVGMTGERMLRRLRYMLFERVMRFPLSRFRTTKPGEVIQSLLGEIDPLGGFIGEVISTPAFQGGLLFVYSAFIFIQDIWLGLAAVSLYPVQAWLIPKLQRRVIQLNRERARNTRALADTISESVGNVPDIHTNDTARWHLAQVAGRLHTNTLIRLQLFRRKYTIKFINNFMNQLTPFFFYLIGGYLVIRGRLDFGSLVAVLAAYKDLAGPWKEVLAYVQRWTDFNSRYVFVVESFAGDDVKAAELLWPKDGAAAQLEGPLRMSSVEGGPGTGGLTVASLEVGPGETVAVTGGESGAREALLRMAAGLEVPASGQVMIGDTQLADATLPQIGATVAYVGPEPGMVNRAMRDNLLYGLLHSAPDLAAVSGEAAEILLREARLTGNITADPDGDWTNYAAAGVDGREALDVRLHQVIEQVGLAESVLTGALQTRLSVGAAEAWTPRILHARAELAASWSEEERADLLEPWEPEAFNSNATLLENLLFALPVQAAPDIAAYAELPEVTGVLDQIGALRLLHEIGWDIAQEFATLVDAVGETSTVIDSFRAYSRPRILAAAELTVASAGQSIEALDRERRAMLLSLAAVYVERRDGLEVLGPERIERLMACRARARALLGARDDFVCFDEDRVSPAETVAENIVNAKRRYDRRSAWRELDARLEQAIRAAGLRDELIGLGLSASVGAGGSALSASARRRVGLARALMKRPRLVVLDGTAASALPTDRALRQTIRESLPEAMILVAAADEATAAAADRHLTIDNDGTLRSAPRAGPGEGPGKEQRRQG